MRFVLVIVGLALGFVQAQNKDISDVINEVRDTAKDTFEKTKDEAKRTADNLTEKSEKLSKDLADKSTSIFDDISSFISGILRDIAGFLKMIFGDNTPGQPAVPPTAGAPSQINSSRIGQKSLILAALGLLSLFSAKVVRAQHNKKHDDGLEGYYRNINVLEENFL